MSKTDQLSEVAIRVEPESKEPFDLHMLDLGDWIQTWEDGVPSHSGIVDDRAPALGVVWIRRDGLGERKLVHCPAYRLHRTRKNHWALRIFKGEA